ncbi:MAG: hypothetical protein KME28_04945 [Pelatocladus maniniholoensis HA4357-MV3]|jgi:hypothetical protein|uniref:Uncharacterized protein n=1 Tax=Pelatocladus maniniholoensis HA4357-MV3 TaxID=1117104 RepID=A0A9E3LSD3_9NOST|nr:hypothetical protein [Pelatocladus maniniholoensis HA4357-MV3]BAZ65454.1 hypothetical protein NIES4106_01930 [Fischerella sp. NIES-4106]
MEQKRVNHVEQIPPKDWGKTPTSVKKLMEDMAQQIEQQENSRSANSTKTPIRNNQSNIKKLIITTIK